MPLSSGRASCLHRVGRCIVDAHECIHEQCELCTQLLPHHVVAWGQFALADTTTLEAALIRFGPRSREFQRLKSAVML
jgi:hypothetical protein